MQHDKLNAEVIKDIAFKNLVKLEEGKGDPEQINAVANQMKVILRTVSVQLKIAKQSGKPVPAQVSAFNEQE